MKFMYEMHMHTAEGSACGRNTGAELVRKYKQLGYSGAVVTDHFINGNSTCPKSDLLNLPWQEKMKYVVAGYLAAKEEGDKVNFSVFLGWEFGILGSDFLTYGLDIDFLMQNENFDRLNIAAYSQLVRKNGGFLVQAHPYRDKSYIKHRFPVDSMYLDAVEIHNAADKLHGANDANEKAKAFAEEHKLPVQGGGDVHSIDDPPSGVMLNTKANNIHDIINAIQNKEIDLIIS